jgi:hypothetical protein
MDSTVLIKLHIKMYRKDDNLVPVGNNYFAALSKNYVYASPEELEKMFPKIRVKKDLKDSEADKVVTPDPKSTNTSNVNKKL